jgi:hypothetical protein
VKFIAAGVCRPVFLLYRFKHSKDSGRRTFPPELLRYFFLVAPHIT